MNARAVPQASIQSAPARQAVRVVLLELFLLQPERRLHQAAQAVRQVFTNRLLDRQVVLPVLLGRIVGLQA